MNYTVPIDTRKRHLQPDRYSRKLYDDDDSDLDNLLSTQEKVEKDNDLWKTLPPEVRRKAALNQGFIYLLLFVFIGIFLLVVNMYNVKQLERLKEEYHLEENRPTPETWWHKALTYHIFVPSFKDSDGNGFGDLKGVLFSLDHLHYLAIDAVMLSGFHLSTFADLGRDISDFRAVDSRCGTMADFQALVNALHNRNIKVLMEFIPNHTSRRHAWFQESRKGGTGNPYKNYYVWNHGRVAPDGTRSPPNNWRSQYGGPAWTLDTVRNEYYYHYYHSSMPDLNHRDPAVKQEMMDIVKFWLDKGVDGVMVEGSHTLFEVDDLTLDEPPEEKDVIRGKPITSHIYTEDLPDVHDYLSTWREFFEMYSVKMNRSVPLFVHAVDDTADDIFRYYHSSADAVMSRQLVSLPTDCAGSCLHELVDAWLSRFTEGQHSIWAVSTLNDGRASRTHSSSIYQSAINMMQLTLPGAALVLYGDELGLHESTVPADSAFALRQSGLGKKSVPSFIPHSTMRWTNESNGGFSKSPNPWLNSNQKTASVQVFNRLAALRKHVSFYKGQIQYIAADDNVFAYTRFAKDSAPYLVVLNMGKSASVLDLMLATGVQSGKLIVHATGSRSSSRQLKEGDNVDIRSLSLQPGDGMVIMLVFDMFVNEP